MYRREVGTRTQLLSDLSGHGIMDVRTDCAPLKKVGGRTDVSIPCILTIASRKASPLGQTSTNQFLFEKAIFDDAFDNVVNDAVNYLRSVAPIPVSLGVMQKLNEFFVHR